MVVYLVEHFKKQLKQLKKKYPSIVKDFAEACGVFDERKAVSVGRSIYKIRISSHDQKKGKSGGFRSYLYMYRKKDMLVPVCIYPKSAQESLRDDELRYHVDRMNEDLLKTHFFDESS